MDLSNIGIGGITLYLFILGIVEAAKKFGVSGNGSLVLSIILGAVLFGLFRANEMGLVPAEVWLWVEVVIFGLGGGLAVSGLYDWTKRLRSG
jgi:hypothetical protein